MLEQILAYHEDLAAIRQDLHAHPELGMQEHRTSGIVAEKLAGWGIEVHRDVGRTGVVGVLRRGNGPASIGLRADMDALPILEATGLAYASTRPGVMHACGHDGHTTMLLGAARYLAEHGRFNGTVNFIFQPAEEGLGGAEAMLADGLFARFPCDTVFGMHNRPGLAVGLAAARSGPMMAGAAIFDIVITGRSAHAARPEDSADPVLAAATLTTALQSIVSRNLPAQDAAVLSVTWLQSGGAYNIIPETATLRGTVRAFGRETMQKVEQRMRVLAESMAAEFGAQAAVDFKFLFAPLVNDAEQATVFASVAAKLLGEAQTERTGPAVMVSEYFSFMLEVRPGAYIKIGNGEASAPVHNDRYYFNDAALPIGAGLYASLVVRKLAASPI